MDRCLVCGKELLPYKRRVLYPGFHARQDFFLRFVKPSFVFPSDGKPLFLCKQPCFAKLEQAMNKVSAVEKIIRDLHGPVGATLALEAGMTASLASFSRADASTQTDPSTCSRADASTQTGPSTCKTSTQTGPSTCKTSTAASLAERQETATGAAQALPGGSSQIPGTVLGKHSLCTDSQTSKAKRFRVLEAVPLSEPLGDEPIASFPCSLPCTPIKYPPSQPHHLSVNCNAEHANPCTPVTRRQTTTLQSPHSLVKVTHTRGKTSRKFIVRSPYKGIVKTLRYNQPGYTAHTLMKTPSIRDATLAHFLKVIHTECGALCLKPSILRVPSVHHLNNFQFDKFVNELKCKAPTLLAVLTAAARPCRSKTREPDPFVIAMAAAVLLKQRNKDLCMVQAIIGCLLYSGHAAKRVYTRLSKLGLCVSHKTVTRVTKSMGVKHDQQVQEWKLASSPQVSPGTEPNISNTVEIHSSDTSSTIQTTDPENTTQACYPPYIIVGDNIDKNVSPRDMRVDNQAKSFHYFHSYAVHDRVNLRAYNNKPPDIDVESLPLTVFLPSMNDCKKLRDNYVILASRVLVKHLSFLAPLKACIPQHIDHIHLKELTKKSDIVPVGVIPKNENVKEEITEILETLQSSYVPTSDDRKHLNTIAFGGDQLTVERSRSAQARRVTSDDPVDALQGLEPFAADWHAEANFLQIIFRRLYSGGSNCDGGTLLQLRNQLNRRNVASNPDGRFNASVDFIEMVTECHILAAGMNFFGLKETTGSPTYNRIPSKAMKSTPEIQWSVLSTTVGHLIDRYVIVQRFSDLAPKTRVPRPRPDPLLTALEQNPHAARVISEHAYARTVSAAPINVQKRRDLPQWLKSQGDWPHASQVVHDTVSDGIFDYACAVLNDGLLLLEFRDAIHEGDGERVLRCWKFLMLYFRAAGHTKYALEAFTFFAKVNGVTSPRLQQQLLWSRFVNSKGGSGKNIPIDLHMEHLNRMLKDVITGLGANISESSIMNASKSLNAIVSLSESFDAQLGIHQASIHHTKKSSDKDRELVLKQLTSDSNVFDYTPGRKHLGFKKISPNIARNLDADALFRWINKHKKELAKQIKFQKLFGQHQ